MKLNVPSCVSIAVAFSRLHSFHCNALPLFYLSGVDPCRHVPASTLDIYEKELLSADHISISQLDPSAFSSSSSSAGFLILPDSSSITTPLRSDSPSRQAVFLDIDGPTVQVNKLASFGNDMKPLPDLVRPLSILKRDGTGRFSFSFYSKRGK
jgi:hypothetical protein